MKKGRSVITQDMLGEIGQAFTEIFGEDAQNAEVDKVKL